LALMVVPWSLRRWQFPQGTGCPGEDDFCFWTTRSHRCHQCNFRAGAPPGVRTADLPITGPALLPTEPKRYPRASMLSTQLSVKPGLLHAPLLDFHH